MKRNLLKLFALTCAMFVNATAWADGSTLKFEPFTIDPGTTKEVTLNLVKGEDAVIGFQCQIVLPTGLTITKDEEEEFNVQAVPGAVKSSKANVIVNYAEATGVLLVYNDKNSEYKEDGGAVTFEFQASNDFKGGNIELKDIVLSLSGNLKATAENTTTEVTAGATQVIPEGPSLYIKDFRITPNETKTVQIELVKGDNPIIGFQCKIQLPDGLTITKDEEEEFNVLAVPGTVKSSKANIIVNYAEATGTLLVYNDKNSAYKDDATAVIEIELKASETFENGFIYIKELVFSLEGNNKQTAGDTKTKVNDPDGIAEIRVNAASEAYTLSGTRVRNMQRGLYIVNGKKVVVK